MRSEQRKTEASGTGRGTHTGTGRGTHTGTEKQLSRPFPLPYRACASARAPARFSLLLTPHFPIRVVAPRPGIGTLGVTPLPHFIPEHRRVAAQNQMPRMRGRAEVADRVHRRPDCSLPEVRDLLLR